MCLASFVLNEFCLYVSLHLFVFIYLFFFIFPSTCNVPSSPSLTHAYRGQGRRANPWRAFALKGMLIVLWTEGGRCAAGSSAEAFGRSPIDWEAGSSLSGSRSGLLSGRLHAQARTHAHAYMRTCIYTYMHTCIHTCAQHTQTYTYLLVCPSVCVFSCCFLCVCGFASGISHGRNWQPDPLRNREQNRRTSDARYRRLVFTQVKVDRLIRITPD